MSTVVRSLLAPVLVLLICRVGHAADELGRFFTTPEERQRLDSLRQANTAPPATVTAVPMASPTATPVPEVPVKVNGVVLRTHGPNTVWVNGINSFDGDLSAAGIEIRVQDATARAVPIRLPNDQGIVRIKPGETYVPAGPLSTGIPDAASEHGTKQ